MMEKQQVKTGYADVNGLHMYYEVHGIGEPLLLLHGGLTTINMFFQILPVLAKTRQVIAVEQQGHGRTADIERPFSFEQMADDTAALLTHLGIKQTDIFGYSAGGSVALYLALRHPELVRKLALASTIYHSDGYYPEVFAALGHADPDAFPSEMRQDYEQIAPNPKGWSALVAKASQQASQPGGMEDDEVKAIHASALVIAAENDIIQTEHSQALAQMLKAPLVTIPNSDHASYIVGEPDILLEKLTSFLEGE